MSMKIFLLGINILKVKFLPISVSETPSILFGYRRFETQILSSKWLFFTFPVFSYCLEVPFSFFPPPSLNTSVHTHRQAALRYNNRKNPTLSDQLFI